MRYYKIPKGTYSHEEVRQFFKQFVNEDNVTIEGEGITKIIKKHD